MCGIVAYIGPKGGDRKASEVLIKGLKRLEYRGYDSAGIGVIQDSGVVGIVKKVGKVINLDNAVKGSPSTIINATLGIAHTRWATHGVPSDKNSHPHANGEESLCVVHNGIIENYATLKKGLQQKGYQFRSETDTEVLAHLIDEIRERSQQSLSFEEAVGLALCQVHGTFGVCFVDAKNPNVLVGARHGSPLILGIGENEQEFFLASDAAAIVEYTRQVVYLEEGDIVTITRSDDGKMKYEISSLHSSRASYDSAMFDALMQLAEEKGDTKELRHQSAERKTDTLELSLASIEKAGHKHFMLKEVLEQPQVSFFFFFLSIVSECDTSTIIFLFRKKRISNICLLSIFF
jgi:glucosamine--fructose-6-phosphate aminotransferase (isomerizing)